jgi:hypothetical protein
VREKKARKRWSRWELNPGRATIRKWSTLKRKTQKRQTRQDGSST